MPPIPRVQARVFTGRIKNAATKPLLFDCLDGNGDVSTYVVKFHGKLGTGIQSEFLAAGIGHHLGVPIPPIATVEISQALVDALPLDGIEYIPKPGLHFGSFHLTEGFSTIGRDFQIPTHLLPHATAIFAFDMLVQNPDRSHHTEAGKPNILCNGEELAAIDHEKAFSFLKDILSSPPPWDLRGYPFVKKHVFFPTLIRQARNEQISFQPFLTRLETLTETVFQELVAPMPQVWYNQVDVDRIQAHMESVRQNLPAFKRGLLEVFA